VAAAAAQGSGAKSEAASDALQRAAQLQAEGKSKQAQAILESLLPGLRKAGPSTELGSSLNALSQMANSSGDYAKALDLAGEAGSVFQVLGDTGGRVRAENNGGISQLYTGDYPAAEQHFAQGLELARRLGDPRLEVQLLNNTGNVYYYEARYYDAMHTYDAATALLETNAKAEWYGYWQQITRFNQATLYQRLGQEERAIETYHQIEASPQKLDASDKAHLYANLGTLYRHIGDPYKAIQVYRQALGLLQQQKDSDGELGVLKNIGIAQGIDLHRLDDALTSFNQALALAKRSNNKREQLQAHLYRGETLYQLQKVQASDPEFSASLALARQIGATEEEWKALYALGRNAQRRGDLAAAEANYRAAIEKIESIRLKLQISGLRSEFLADKRDVYDALISLLLPRGDAAEIFSWMERSRSRLFQDKLQSQRKDGGSPPSLREVQQRLPQGAALLETWDGGDQVAVVWITSSESGLAGKRLTAGESQSIAAATQELSRAGGSWRRASAALSALLPAGIPVLGNAEVSHLIVGPDGRFSLLPFEALQNGTSGALMVERFDATYLPTAMLLLREPGPAPRLAWPWQPELAAFGDPLEPAAAGLVAALPQARNEIESVAAMCKGRKRLRLGSQDLKAAFLVPGAAIAPLLHLATHAVADSERTDRSRLLFSPTPEGRFSNFVLLREVYEMDLRGVRLATLSACDTERGRVIRGEGVQAFSRAMLSAGSRATITTLWKVDDAATAEFMRQFYFYLLRKHQAPAEALRSAKLKFLNSGGEFSQPRYWAAFVLNGDGAQRLPVYFSWLDVALATAGAMALILVWRFLLGKARRAAAK
jgi:CHAT domain-containing protein